MGGRFWKTLVGVFLFSHVTAEPIQLIYPNDDNSELVLNEHALNLLASIPAPISIVSVLGAIHSGKSFLLNQLFPDQPQFQLGHSVHPKTKGIWMHYPPPKVGNISVVLLDTEGLFSSEATESYDAKLFSIAYLLSSQVILNSVRQIGVHELSLFEILLKQSQLFGLRSTSRHLLGGQLFAALRQEDSVRPSLIWAVQDATAKFDDLTPTQWLEEVMRSRHKRQRGREEGREGRDGREEKDSNFHEWFASISCWAIPPPAKFQLWGELERLQGDEFDPLYRRRMEEVRGELRERMEREERRREGERRRGEEGKEDMGVVSLFEWRSGAQVAQLLNSLVYDIKGREGHGEDEEKEGEEREMFPEVIDLWQSFARSQVNLMRRDAELYHQKSTANIVDNANNRIACMQNHWEENFVETATLCEANVWLCANKIHEKTESSKKSAIVLWEKLTNGFEKEASETAVDMVRTLDLLSSQSQKSHCELVSSMCEFANNNWLRKFDEGITHIPRPMSPNLYEEALTNLDKEMLQMRSAFLTAVSCEGEIEREKSCCAISFSLFDERAARKLGDASNANKELVLRTLRDASETAKDLLAENKFSSKIYSEIFYERLDSFFDDLHANSMEIFMRMTENLTSWEFYEMHKKILHQELTEKIEILRKGWRKECLLRLREGVKMLKKTVAEQVRTRIAIHLPLDESSLESELTQILTETKAHLVSLPSLQFCISSPLVLPTLSSPIEKADPIFQDIRHKNIEAIQTLVLPVLEEVYQFAEANLSRYWKASTFRKAVVNDATARISRVRGVSGVDDRLSRTVAENWLSDKKIEHLTTQVKQKTKFTLMQIALQVALLLISWYTNKLSIYRLFSLRLNKVLSRVTSFALFLLLSAFIWFPDTLLPSPLRHMISLLFKATDIFHSILLSFGLNYYVSVFLTFSLFSFFFYFFLLRKLRNPQFIFGSYLKQVATPLNLKKQQ